MAAISRLGPRARWPGMAAPGAAFCAQRTGEATRHGSRDGNGQPMIAAFGRDRYDGDLREVQDVSTCALPWRVDRRR